MRTPRVLAAVALTVIVCFASTPATATDVSFPELAALAADAAAGDAAARNEIAAITSIDGRPVDTESLLSGAPDEVDRRLTTLASVSETASVVDPATARSEAAAILAGPDYRRTPPEPPGWLQRLGEWLGRLIPDELGAVLANPAVWLLVLAIGISTIAYFLTRDRRRRRDDAVSEASNGGAHLRRSADELERLARLAANNGDYSTAVRRRFEAGAVRLAQRGILPHESTSTSGAIRRAVPTPTMVDLAQTFDRVAYGNRSATSTDAQTAEDGWTTVMMELSDRA